MKEVSLASVLTKLESGSRPKGGVSKDSGKIPSLGGEHINNQGGFNLEKLKFIEQNFYDKLNSGKIKQKDILVVKDGATTGKTSFVKKDFPFQNAAINEHVFRIEINQDLAEPRYIFHFLFSNVGQSHILKDFRGATVGGISRNFVNKVKIPLPPLPEQKRIAEVLDKADALRQKRRLALQKLDTLLQSVFLEMFGDPVKNPMGWEVKPLQKISKFSQGTQVPLENQVLEKKGGYERFLRISDYTTICERRFVNLDAKYFVNKEDIVIVRYGASAGFVGMGIEGILANNLFKINFDKNLINPTYLFHYLHTEKFRLFIRNTAFGAAMPALSFTSMNRFEVLLPPIELQNKFSAIVKKIVEIKKQKQNSLDKFENLFQSLQQKAFKGELFDNELENELTDEKKVWQQTSLS